MPPVMKPFHTAVASFVDGSHTPRAFLESCIETIEALEPEVGAFVTLQIDRAREAADLATLRYKEGKPLSPIDGMPVGIKDIIETDDMPTEMGSSLFTGYRSMFDAASVSALREAGAVVVGKTVTTEFASFHPRGTKNPWDTTRTPGGSSSGSAAAVGGGMLPGALGTQVVGSILRPAGFCGAIGFKPSVGAINRGGSMDLLSQSCTGVLTASLEDAWLMAMAIASRVGGDPGHVPLAGPATPPPPAAPRAIAVLQTPGWSLASDAAKAELDRAIAMLKQHGVKIITRADNADLEALETALPNAEPLTRLINAWEWRWPLNVLYARDAAGLSPSMRERHAEMAKLTAEDYVTAITKRAAMRALHARLAAVADATITLTSTGAAPVGLGSTGNPIFVVPGSHLGVPAITQPLLKESGLPLGLQLLGFHGHDAGLFSTAFAVRSMMMGH